MATKAKAKGGTGRGTDKKNWTRWGASVKGKKARKIIADNKLNKPDKSVEFSKGKSADKNDNAAKK